ncbi:MAG: alpha,alpha-trehalose-phosphate synthase (UDP-forming) [Bradymonadaceae bacterium]
MSDVDALTIVSNRLPIVMQCTDGGWHIEPGSGGLVQAMTPILERLGGRWVGWPGIAAEDGNGWHPELEKISEEHKYALDPVLLTHDEIEGFYAGFSNSVIWPLFHGFADRCDFDPEFHRIYLEVNEKFARTISEKAGQDDFLWIHDYHLIETGRLLREHGQRGELAFFLHIPFPSMENFGKLPWRQGILESLLSYDLIGFQTERDLRNFLQCIERLDGRLELEAQQEDMVWIRRGGHTIRAGFFPIGMHFSEFSHRASTAQVASRVEELREEIGPYKILLGIDRLDYTKGLIHRLEAFECALEEHPDLLEEVVFFQLVVPSRENVPEYQLLKQDFDRIVGRINGRFSTASWQPIRYLYNTVSPEELAALYRMASVAVVTPLRDGMNLVAKEYCACQVDETGVLLLSEFAGAAAQLGKGALLINPYDLKATAAGIHRAITMPQDERIARMRGLRQVVRSTDVFWWANRFVQAALSDEIPKTAARTNTYRARSVYPSPDQHRSPPVSP